jgi:hypothetical protein
VSRILCVILVAIALSVASVYGQGITGAITGVVTDPAQAVVPRAMVTVRNLATGVISRAQTTSAGVYNVPSLILGPYEVTVSAAGFKTAVRQNVVVETASVVRVDIGLELGAVGEKVTITAEAPLLQAERAEAGTEVTRKMLNVLPFQLTGSLRDPTAFLRLTPGASGGQYGASIAGGRQFLNEVFVDGVPVAYNGTQNVPDTARPSFDTVAEFRVETATPAAEYGRTSGGVVLLATRSGTNDIHGNVVALLHNGYFDARRFNARIPDITRQGEFAGSLGGPVFIPKLFNGRNRTFFYANYTRLPRINVTQGQTSTVPTAAMKRGDFSAYPTVIFDPLTADTTGLRQPFAGNIIPTARISSVAKTIQSYIPDPNVAGFASNWLGESPTTENTKTFQTRIDHQISENNKISGSIRYKSNPRSFSNGPLPRLLDGYTDSSDSRGGNLSDDYIIRPNLVNRVQLGYSRFADPTRINNVLGNPLVPIQIPGTFLSAFPAITFTGQGMNPYHNGDTDRTETDDNYNLGESLNWTHGKHNFKFGVRVDQWRNNSISPLSGSPGSYSFNQLTTAQPNVNNTGHSYASFLLGAASSATMNQSPPNQSRSQYFAFYAQDDFKVTRKLTVNYGLRYEFQQPWWDPGGIVSQMDPTVPNPGAGGRLGAIVFGGSGSGRLGVDRFLQTYYNGWGPRLGIAYQAAQNTVIRVGYGIMYEPLRGSSLTRTGFSTNVSVTSSDSYAPALWLDTGWPASVIKKAPFIDPTLQNGQSVSMLSKGEAAYPGRVQQWQIGIQHTIKGVLLDGSYVGTVGHGLPNSQAMNQLPPSYLALGDLLRQSITAPAVVAAGYQLPYAGFTGTLAQALRSFPQYQGVTMLAQPISNSNYQGLLFKAEKRFSNGLQFLAAYTLSKSFDDIRTPIDIYNRQIEKGLGLDSNTGDNPQVLVVSYYYEMPWGAGKRFLHSGLIGNVLGGFSVAGINTYRSGGLIAIGATNTLPIFNGGNRPNLIGGVPILIGPDRGSFRPQNGLSGEPGDVYLNKAAFAQPAPYTFGNLGPVLPNIRTFGSINEDLSIVKRQRLWREGRTVEFRCDMFNAFNRHNLGAPNTDLTSVNFGKITSRGNARTIEFGFRLDF